MSKKKIAIFCGGRGSQYITREALRRSDIDLTLLVNAYDDGLSTGMLRALVPGMLGPSDFRKNLSYLLRLYSPMQLSLQKLIEYRFPLNFGVAGFEAIRGYVAGDDAAMPESWRKIHSETGRDKQADIRAYVATFCTYLQKKGMEFDFSDCSFGNILFAGIYLSCGENFNRASGLLSALVDADGHLVNVSKGEDRTLTAIKADGQILSRESEVVGKQSKERIVEIFFTEHPVTRETAAQLQSYTLEDKIAWFNQHSLTCEISDECRAAILEADAIIYGPGTQHSSLLPSYMIAGETIRQSKAIKIFVANLHYDHDIYGLSVNDLVERALHYLGDAGNSGKSIDYVLANKPYEIREDSVLLLPVDDVRPSELFGARVLYEQFCSPADPNIHSGFAVVSCCKNLIEENGPSAADKRTLEIFVDLYKRSILIESLAQELTEIDWRKRFDKIILTFNRVDDPGNVKLPSYIEARYVKKGKIEVQNSVLASWLTDSRSEYLITISGDGEYRLRETLALIDTSNYLNVGAVLGSRAQSRKQLQTSLRYAYGDGFLIRIISLLGSLLVTSLFMARFGMVFSDPLTGMRLIRRSYLNEKFRKDFLATRSKSSGAVIKLLIKHGIEICELPVTYRTFPGFTDTAWRLRRGIRNLWGLVG